MRLTFTDLRALKGTSTLTMREVETEEEAVAAASAGLDLL